MTWKGRFIDWQHLTAEQQAEAHALHPVSVPQDHAFYIKVDGHISKRKPVISLAACRRLTNSILEAPRSKTDLRDWTGSPRFHLTHD